ncbi:polyphosphate kinase 1 [uncultured Mailhella sp.]|uniref:polyphosphate kinase 1 n=1 Tax=uncultured Mailhella sp. TaxID=1981031 RepID=UPI0025E68F7B|nr:polyphosphate kinase 1 [uncultured Mailhella sp.]
MTEKKKGEVLRETRRKVDLAAQEYYLNRELSWLDFNARVLETALDEKLPLLEQTKFLAIFYNNLDEFFMVRVAKLLHRYREGAAAEEPEDMTPSRQLAEIRRKASALLATASEYWLKTLAPKLREKDVHLVRYGELSEKQRRFLLAYFRDEIYPVLTPQAIDPGHPFPTISNLSLNFIIQLQGRDGVDRFARLRCPSNVPRFIFIPRNKDATTYASLGLKANVRDADILPVEELIREHLGLLFPGYRVIDCGLFRITRNTDVTIDEDESDDLLEAVQDMVDQRRFGGVVRLETARGMSGSLSEFLIKKLSLKPFQIYRVKGPLAFAQFMALYGLDRPGLKTPPHSPAMPPVLQADALFRVIRGQDVFLHHPYDSFSPVVDFVQKAAEDPKVISIKQTLYRVGNDSPIVRALIEARRRGKQVTAVVELKARFDEERNITWAEELEREGVNVVYGFVGMKIHAKLCLVVRREEEGVVSYAHIGTGNYNASTAKMYTDMGIFTSQPDICADMADLFNVMTGYAVKDNYRELLVSPNSMRRRLIEQIQNEIAVCSRGGEGEIIMKCNQLVDRKIIRALYMASMAGVKVRLLVRGICCLRPGLPGVSENITVRSIVGRFLEHARVYWFRNDNNPCMFMGSADMMVRNLDRRIEVLTPVLDENIRRILTDVLRLQLADNMQAWELMGSGDYVRLRPGEGQSAVNSQEALLVQR